MAKVDLDPNFREFLKSLNSAGVEYLVLGGYAVIHYGYRRFTDDLDVWIAVDADTAAKVSRVLQSFAGFPAAKVTPSLFQQEGLVFIFGRAPVRIDILTGPSGVSFRECFERRNVVDWDRIAVPLISLDDLKANKLASGRPKDMADLENLPPGPAAERPRAKRRPRKGR
jgi:predicted nucleotidyltransferase